MYLLKAKRSYGVQKHSRWFLTCFSAPEVQNVCLIPACRMLERPSMLKRCWKSHTEGRDEGVLHLLLKLQLIPPGQLLHQLLRILANGCLHPTQQLLQHGVGHQP
ncbi:hypothetical protein SKAU_G00083200 [Synaphobranchus kaupii]|uniref:Uncharacterized protein n=1 Tax=Synaphobranchus kaupii TaxID=118154 RepID=A0A9Q1FVB6_SYNKA|nr:hypothetical protein SKAU_G00083200 [Synaphobranchus kaupii]